LGVTNSNEQSFRFRLPPPAGGLDLSAPPEAMETDRLSDSENLWWSRGKLRTRPGLSTNNQRRLVTTPMPEGYFVYGGIHTTGTAVKDKDGNPLVWEHYKFGTTEYLYPFYIDENGAEVPLEDDDGEPMQHFQNSSMLVANNEAGKPLFFTADGIFSNTGESMSGRWTNVEEFCHVPLMLVGGIGTNVKNSEYAEGTLFQAKNCLTPRFQAQYTTDGKGIYFYLPQKRLDAEDVVVRYTDGAGQEHTYTVPYDDTVSPFANGKRLAVDRVAGCVWFENINAVPMALSADTRGGNLTVEAQKTDARAREKILGMRLACWFGGDSGGGEKGARLFLAGNPDYPHMLCWSDTNNALYFPESNFAYIGDATQSITALAKQEDMLVIFKEREMYAATYTAQSVSERAFLDGEVGEVTAVTASLPITPLSAEIGCDCPETIALCHNRLVWAHSQEGVFTLLSQNPYSTRNIRPLSAPIDAGLKSLPAAAWENASAATFEGWYLLLTGDTVWVLRYDDTAFVRFGTTDRKAQQALCWYRWNITLANVTWSRLVGGKIPVLCGLFNLSGGYMYLQYVFDGDVDMVPVSGGCASKPVMFRAATACMDMGETGRYKDITGLWLDMTCDGTLTLSLADETGSLWYATQGATTRGVRMLPSVRFVKRAKLCVSGSGVVAWGESELSGCEKGKVR